MLIQVATQPVLHGLFQYWNGKRGPHLMPDRRDIDPTEIDRSILPHIMLFEMTGARIRYRLVGTEVVRRSRFDPTGKYLDEVLQGSYLAHAQSVFRELADGQAPLYSESRFRWDIAGHLYARRIFLPLSWNGVSPGMALAAQLFESSGPGADQPLTTAVHEGTTTSPVV
jgi:hypothetical protein